MEQENPTGIDSGASTLERLEALITADDAPQEAPIEAQSDDQPADAPTESDEPETDEPKQENEPPEYQLSDVAKLLGADESSLDVDDDGNVLVKTKIDGAEGRAKFADLLKSYQLQGHVDKQVREIADQRKAFEAQTQAYQQQMQVEQEIVDKLAEVKSIESTLQQYQSIDWNALTDQDPVQALKLDRQYRELQQAHYTKSQEVNAARNHIHQQRSEQQQTTLATERQALLNALPDWADEAKASKERQAIVADLTERGFAQSEIQNLTNHKAVLLARDAMLYRQQQAAKTVTEKQVRAAPRIIKPGSSQQNTAQKSVQNLKNAVRTTGSKQSVVDYLLASGKV